MTHIQVQKMFSNVFSPAGSDDNSARVSVEASINSDYPGLKAMLAEHCKEMKVCAKIQHSKKGITTVTFQGPKILFPLTLETLKAKLDQLENTAIVWDAYVPVSDDNRLFSITIEETPPALKRDPSSGNFELFDVEEIPIGGSAVSSLNEVSQSFIQKVTMILNSFCVAKGWMPQVKKEYISVKHSASDQRFSFEISTLSSMDVLIQKVELELKLARPLQKFLYAIEDGDALVVTDVKNLREGLLYYVLATFEMIPQKKTAKFSTMEEFFGKLKTEEDMPDDLVEMTKEKFGLQGINFKQLMKTGELAITDAELEKYGINQGGLRKAILSVIKSSQ